MSQHFAALSQQLYGQQLPANKYNQPQTAQTATTTAPGGMYQTPGYIDQSPAAPGAIYAAAPPQFGSAAPTAGQPQYNPFSPAAIQGQYAPRMSGYPLAVAPGSYAGVPRGFTPMPRLRVVINH